MCPPTSRPQQRRIEVDVHIYIQIIAQAFEDGIFRYHESNVQVARRPAVDTLAAIAFQFNDLAVRHTGGNGDADILAVHRQYLLMSPGGIPKRQVQIGMEILSAKTCIRPATAACTVSEHLFKEIGEAACTVSGNSCPSEEYQYVPLPSVPKPAPP